MSKDKKKRNFADQFKAKLGRYYKTIKPYSRVLLGTTLEGKDTAFVIRAARRQPERSFFSARIYSLPDLIHEIHTQPDSVLKKEEFRELLETLPLLLRHIAITQEKYFIGKIDNHPFDIFIAPERLVKKEGKNANIYRALHIQTKRLYQHPPRKMMFDEWVSFLQSTIEDKILPVDYGINGHIHFYNRILLSESPSIEELKNALKKIYVPYNRYVDTMSVSFALVNPKNDITIMTLYFYPRLFSLSAFDLDLEKTKEVYPEENLVKTSFKW